MKNFACVVVPVVVGGGLQFTFSHRLASCTEIKAPLMTSDLLIYLMQFVTSKEPSTTSLLNENGPLHLGTACLPGRPAWLKLMMAISYLFAYQVKLKTILKICYLKSQPKAISTLTPFILIMHTHKQRDPVVIL